HAVAASGELTLPAGAEPLAAAASPSQPAGPRSAWRPPWRPYPQRPAGATPARPTARQRNPRFRGRQQQDAHELLRTLLDASKTEEVRRIQTAILASLGALRSQAGAAGATDRARALNHSARDSTVIDAEFSGRLVSELVCLQCGRASRTPEIFQDLMLPITGDVHHRPSAAPRSVSPSTSSTARTPEPKHLRRKNRRQQRLTKKQQKRRPSSSGSSRLRRAGWTRMEAEKKLESLTLEKPAAEESEMKEAGAEKPAAEESEMKEAGAEKPAAEESEMKEARWQAEELEMKEAVQRSQADEELEMKEAGVEKPAAEESEMKEAGGGVEKPAAEESVVKEAQQDASKEKLSRTLAATWTPAWRRKSGTPELLNRTDTLEGCLADSSEPEETDNKASTKAPPLCGQSRCPTWHAGALPVPVHCRRVAHRWQPVRCEGCGASTDHSKRLLIDQPPRLLTLQLKRFAQQGRQLRKSGSHIRCPLLLRLAVASGQLIDFQLCSIVEHSIRSAWRRSLHRLRVRPVRRWYHISDSHVSPASEAQALNAEAYLLFYARIGPETSAGDSQPAESATSGADASRVGHCGPFACLRESSAASGRLYFYFIVYTAALHHGLLAMAKPTEPLGGGHSLNNCPAELRAARWWCAHKMMQAASKMTRRFWPGVWQHEEQRHADQPHHCGVVHTDSDGLGVVERLPAERARSPRRRSSATTSIRPVMQRSRAMRCLYGLHVPLMPMKAEPHVQPLRCALRNFQASHGAVLRLLGNSFELIMSNLFVSLALVKNLLALTVDDRKTLCHLERVRDSPGGQDDGVSDQQQQNHREQVRVLDGLRKRMALLDVGEDAVHPPGLRQHGAEGGGVAEVQSRPVCAQHFKALVDHCEFAAITMQEAPRKSSRVRLAKDSSALNDEFASCTASQRCSVSLRASAALISEVEPDVEPADTLRCRRGGDRTETSPSKIRVQLQLFCMGGCFCMVLQDWEAANDDELHAEVFELLTRHSNLFRSSFRSRHADDNHDAKVVHLQGSHGTAAQEKRGRQADFSTAQKQLHQIRLTSNAFERIQNSMYSMSGQLKLPSVVTHSRCTRWPLCQARPQEQRQQQQQRPRTQAAHDSSATPCRRPRPPIYSFTSMRRCDQDGGSAIKAQPSAAKVAFHRAARCPSGNSSLAKLRRLEGVRDPRPALLSAPPPSAAPCCTELCNGTPRATSVPLSSWELSVCGVCGTWLRQPHQELELDCRRPRNHSSFWGVREKTANYNCTQITTSPTKTTLTTTTDRPHTHSEHTTTPTTTTPTTTTPTTTTPTTTIRPQPLRQHTPTKPLDNHSDTTTPTTHSDSNHSDYNHSDSNHSDNHSDYNHCDYNHSDFNHSDYNHSDSNHSDNNHSDYNHSDNNHSNLNFSDNNHRQQLLQQQPLRPQPLRQQPLRQQPLRQTTTPTSTSPTTTTPTTITPTTTTPTTTTRQTTTPTTTNSDNNHSDNNHSDNHSKQTHSDNNHSDNNHSDNNHSDNNHSDNNHSDNNHSDNNHTTTTTPTTTLQQQPSNNNHSDNNHSRQQTTPTTTTPTTTPTTTTPTTTTPTTTTPTTTVENDRRRRR
uniref:ubiquitinyl hydrolase 1 n=1 Tax=Macrostomum lignano TaxID=282301 RepID=A0A1I8FB22_9PLAT